MNEPVISIVIPCYNASNYIGETLNSILRQAQANFEVIIIDDGSTDALKQTLGNFDDKRIVYSYQSNQGVSAARNEGMKFAKGNYIIFFDADDVMTDDFLSARYEALKSEPDLDFVSGEVTRFKNGIDLNGYYRGFEQPSEILLYQPEVNTCPSNYMFKKAFLEKNQLNFCKELSSTADRFFLLQCCKYGKYKLVYGTGKLKYRVSDSSMSAILNLNLVQDNEHYYNLLLKNNLIPDEIRNKSLFLGNFIICASYWKINCKMKAFKFALKAFKLQPLMFIRKLF